jgi:hypothetical protein
MSGGWRAAALIAVVTAGSFDVGAREAEGEAGQAIVGGAASTRRSVIRFSGAGICSATVLAPNLLLTAKHCVAQTFPGAFNCAQDGELEVDPDENVTYPDAGKFGDVLPVADMTVGRAGTSPFAPRVASVLVSPGETICASDLALVILDRALDDPVLAPIRLAGPPLAGEPLVAVGIGVASGTELAESLQERDVAVIAVGPAPGSSKTDPVQPGFFSIGEALCRGDSGGPALTPGGAAIGVASSVSNPDLVSPSGTSDDCVGQYVRGKLQATEPHAELIRSAFAAAGATPWEEGQPDPRADLGALGDPCAADGECASNVCVQGPGGEAACSQGCLEAACPQRFECQEVEDRRRCVPTPDETGEDEADGEGCAASGARSGRGSTRWASLLVVGVIALLRAGSARRTRPAAGRPRSAGSPPDRRRS